MRRAAMLRSASHRLRVPLLRAPRRNAVRLPPDCHATAHTTDVFLWQGNAASSWHSAIESATGAKPLAGGDATMGAGSIAESSSDSIADALRQRHHDAIAAIHPWFVSAFSPSYFHTTTPQAQMRHIESLAYCLSMGTEPKLS